MSKKGQEIVKVIRENLKNGKPVFLGRYLADRHNGICLSEVGLDPANWKQSQWNEFNQFLKKNGLARTRYAIVVRKPTLRTARTRTAVSIFN